MWKRANGFAFESKRTIDVGFRFDHNALKNKGFDYTMECKINFKALYTTLKAKSNSARGNK